MNLEEVHSEHLDLVRTSASDVNGALARHESATLRNDDPTIPFTNDIEMTDMHTRETNQGKEGGKGEYTGWSRGLRTKNTKNTLLLKML